MGPQQSVVTDLGVNKAVFNNGCLFLVLADEEFDELCFEFGLELDEIVSKRHHTRSNYSASYCVCHVLITRDLF